MNQILPRTLLSLIGSFWTTVFRSAALLRQLLRGVLSVHGQSEISADELVSSVSAKEVPAGRTTAWERFVFASNNRAKFEYGDLASRYGTSYMYGEDSSNEGEYYCDPTIISVAFLYDDPVKPTRILCEGIDYKVLPGKIVFRTPLTYVDGQTAVFHARKVLRESGFVTSRLGYVLNLQLADRIYRKVPFDAIWRMYTYGATWLDTMRILGGASGTPVTLQDETVELMLVDRAVATVYTDKSVHVGPSSYSLPLARGQVLPQGTPVFSTIQVLHDKQQYVSELVPAAYRSGNLLRFGSEYAQGNSLIIVKAAVKGEASAALKVLPDVLPADVRLLVLTTVDTQPLQLGTFGGSAKAGKCAVPSLTGVTAAVLSTSSKKHKHAGY